MQVEPLSWNRMKEAGGQTGRGFWGLLQGESSMAGSGEPVRRNQVRAGLRDDSFDEQAGSCSASGIRPRSERDCSSQPLSLLCLQEKIRALGPRPTCSFTLQLRGPRSGACTLLTHPHHPTSWLLQPRCSGARARAPGSPSVKCGARTWHPEHTFGMSRGAGVGWESYPSIFSAVLQQNPTLGTLPRVEGKGKTHDLQVLLSSAASAKPPSATAAGDLRVCQPCSREEEPALCCRQTSPGPQTIQVCAWV